MTTHVRPQPGILQIAPYRGGASRVPGVADVVKLSSNENPFGPCDAAKEAWRRSGHDLHRYPSGDHAALRAAIGEAHRLDPERIVCGNGSGEMLHLIAQAYSGPGDEVLYTEHGFGLYPIVARAAGAAPIVAPERERTIDVGMLLSHVTRRTRLVFIANPANPTGTMIGGNEIARLAAELPERALLVLDGAYAEYVDGYDGGAALIEGRDNVVMTRTLSKIHGLGGLRVGWAYGPPHVIDALMRIRGPFNLSEMQQQTAEAAMRDRAWVPRCRSENARLRAWTAEALAEIGVPSDTSCANFVLARFASEDEASACDGHLRSHGILVRSTVSYGLPHCLQDHHRRRGIVPPRRPRHRALPRRLRLRAGAWARRRRGPNRGRSTAAWR